MPYFLLGENGTKFRALIDGSPKRTPKFSYIFLVGVLLVILFFLSFLAALSA